jgi:hypothetical protein
MTDPIDLAGTWDVTVKTPIGSLAVEYTFTSSVDGLAGSATLKGDTVPLNDLVVDGQRVTWQQSVTKPMRLNLDFDVQVEGSQLVGHSKAGRLPRSTVSGSRRG